MKLKSLLCPLVIGLLFTASGAQAMDIGLLAPTDNKVRAEVYYEQFERKIDQGFPFGQGSSPGLQEEDRVVARLSLTPQRSWGVSLEVGGTDSKHSEDVAPMFGAGAHVVVLEQGNFYTSAFGRMTWVTGVEYSEHSTVTDGTNYLTGSWERDEEYIEYGLGVQLGYVWQPCASARITGYAGGMASFLDDTKSEDRISGSFYLDGMAEPETFADKDSSVDIDESHVAQFFAGIEMALLPLDGGIRVEGRFYDRTSLSASLFLNF